MVLGNRGLEQRAVSHGYRRREEIAAAWHPASDRKTSRRQPGSPFALSRAQRLELLAGPHSCGRKGLIEFHAARRGKETMRAASAPRPGCRKKTQFGDTRRWDSPDSG